MSLSIFQTLALGADVWKIERDVKLFLLEISLEKTLQIWKLEVRIQQLTLFVIYWFHIQCDNGLIYGAPFLFLFFFFKEAGIFQMRM